MELIIIFLPDILKVFTKGRQESALRDKVSGQIIPQIVENIRPEIEKSLDQMKDEMIQGAQEQIGSFIDSEVESLEAMRSVYSSYMLFSFSSYLPALLRMVSQSFYHRIQSLLSAHRCS